MEVKDACPCQWNEAALGIYIGKRQKWDGWKALSACEEEDGVSVRKRKEADEGSNGVLVKRSHCEVVVDIS